MFGSFPRRASRIARGIEDVDDGWCDCPRDVASDKLVSILRGLGQKSRSICIKCNRKIRPIEPDAGSEVES